MHSFIQNLEDKIYVV